MYSRFPLATTEAYLIFKYLNTSKSGYLTLDEFYHVYDATLCHWNVARQEKEWYDDCPERVKALLEAIRKAVCHPSFEYAICELNLIWT